MRALLRNLWPDTLAGRTTLVLLCSLLALHLGSVWVHEASVRSSDRQARERSLSEGLAQAARTLGAVPEAARDATAHTLSTPSLELHWRSGETWANTRSEDSELSGLIMHLSAIPELAGIRLAWADGERHLLVGALPLSAGGQVNFATPQFRSQHGRIFDASGVMSLVGVAFGIALISVLVVRTMTRPLRQLSKAADSIGRDPAPVAMREEGPSEVREAARAFNGMQDRIRRLLEDRLQALAAVSHDLRTPLARMRLRVGFLEDAESRDRIDSDLDEMERLVEATLGYLREGRDAEQPRQTDLVALVRTVCDSASDRGGTVELDAPERMVIPLRRTAIRRALANLIENAVIHGAGQVSVTVSAEIDQVVVDVADRGSGIPECDLPRVLDPFVRLDASRSRATGGVGLGLAIARRAIEACGGRLALRNREGGGLAVTVSLPRSGMIIPYAGERGTSS